MHMPKTIMDHLKELEKHGYCVGEDVAEDGTPYGYVVREDGETDAVTITMTLEKKKPNFLQQFR